MSDSMSPRDCRKFLAAFADGELDVRDNCRVLEQLAMDPANARRVAHQQQLRELVKRCVEEQQEAIGGCPASLRQEIEALAASARGCAGCAGGS